MTDLLNSLKSDLTDRRLLPILLALGLLLVGAIAYGVLAGGGSSSSPSPVAAVASPGLSQHSSPAVSRAPANSSAAVSETAEGARYQRGGGAHDPFLALPSAAPAKSRAATTTSGGGSATSSSPSTAPSTGGQSTSTKPSSGGGGTSPAQPTTPPKPKRVHKLTFTVGVLFGLAPTTPGQTSQLTPYASLKRLEPLPSASNPLIIFEGVSSSRKNAIFTLARETIVKGSATCLPSTLQCEAIDLAVGQTEELQYLEPSGQSVTYELALVSIAWHETTVTTNAKTARLDRPAHVGQALLRRLDPPIQSHLHFSASRGVLVYLAHHGL
jgi:hypothetical protein